MAASDCDLDNEQQQIKGIKAQIKTWASRDKKSKETDGVKPNKNGEFLFLTVDMQPRVAVTRCQWFNTPTNPGMLPSAADEKELSEKQEIECVEYALQNMRALLKGRLLDPTVEDWKNASWDKHPAYKFLAKDGAEGKGLKKGKGLPSICVIAIQDQILMCHVMALNMVSIKERMPFSQSLESIRTKLGIQKKWTISFDGFDNIKSDPIFKRIEENKIV